MSLDTIVDEIIASLPDQPEEQPVPNYSIPGKDFVDEEALSRLAAMNPINYDRVRESEAKRLGIRITVLDKEISTRRKDKTSPKLDFSDVHPWPGAIDTATLLSEISSTVQRFIICQEETAHAVALWVAMTWLMDVVQVAPLAVITAPEKRCGKSQLLFLLAKLVYRPLTASNISPAALFRSIDAWHPTLLVDEADSFMKENEELRGLLNCGHTRDSAYIVRVVGDDHIPKKFNVWGAKAIAGIGHLADTLMDRAIVLELRRKLPSEQTERLRYVERGHFESISSKLARVAEDYRDTIREIRPTLPESLNDRAQDNWEPLMAIAEVAGGIWPDLARRAALKLSGSDSPAQSIGTELLADIQETFDMKRVDRISSADLIAALCEDTEKHWATYNRGKPITFRQISKRLSEYGICSKTIRIGIETPKGYEKIQFQEAFDRYLSPHPETGPQTPQTAPDAEESVADKENVAATETAPATSNPAPVVDCGGVADTTPRTTAKPFIGPVSMDDLTGPFRRRRERENRL